MIAVARGGGGVEPLVGRWDAAELADAQERLAVVGGGSGPIEQMVERVDHTHTPEQLVAIGRDVESLTLARALNYQINHRVFQNGHKTVVFRG